MYIILHEKETGEEIKVTFPYDSIEDSDNTPATIWWTDKNGKHSKIVEESVEQIDKATIHN